MFTVVLLTSPVAPRLDPALVDALRNAWGGGDAVWLAPDEAAEFAVATLPANFREVWTECQAMGVDLNAVPQINRRKRMLIADMDSTMIRQECIDELAEMAGVGDQVRDITARAMNGELDFDGALTERVRLLAGLDLDVIDRVLEERITLMPGAVTLLRTMKSDGVHTALVSGGFTAFTTRVTDWLGFDEHRANRLATQGGMLTGDVVPPILGREAKVAALRDISARLGLLPADVLAVGDGANDLGMLQLAGMGVALHAKPVVAAQCDLRINHGDLTALLYLQGYSRAEFVDELPGS